jgi:hypothetical protein
MTDKRRLVGNEVVGARLPPRPHHRYLDQQALAQLQARLKPDRGDQLNFNQFAYGVLLIAVLAVIGIGTGFINWAFLLYGVTAVGLKQPSNQIFMCALICLVIIPISTLLQKGTVANTFSVMTFYFLLIGLIRASLELRGKA